MMIIYYYEMEIISKFVFKVALSATHISSKRYILPGQEIARGRNLRAAKGTTLPRPGRQGSPVDVEKSCKRGVHGCNQPCTHTADPVFCANSVTEVEEFFLQNNDTAP